MTYASEVFKGIKELRDRIEKCDDPAEAILLQSELLEILNNSLNDQKFKESLLERPSN